IRDRNVTGVQTCALPISRGPGEPAVGAVRRRIEPEAQILGRQAARSLVEIEEPEQRTRVAAARGVYRRRSLRRESGAEICVDHRSEERRVGKEWRRGWGV